MKIHENEGKAWKPTTTINKSHKEKQKNKSIEQIALATSFSNLIQSKGEMKSFLCFLHLLFYQTNKQKLNNKSEEYEDENIGIEKQMRHNFWWYIGKLIEKVLR